MEDDRPAAERAGDAEIDEEDALPDWRQFAKFARSHKQDDGAILVPFIPKRGEKDFEPIKMQSDLISSKEATLSQHQRNLLNESRQALFSALSTGSRHHSSRAHNAFTWRPELDGGRATFDGRVSAYGIHFLNMGHYHAGRKQLELMPEEALYLCERGAIELWREGESFDGGVARVPMSVQQAWAEVIGHDELTIERFQVYAYLKRLGYVLSRARATTSSESVSRTPLGPPGLLAPIQLVKDVFVSFVETFRRLFVRIPRQIQLSVTRTLGRAEGKLLSMLSSRRWTSYDKIFGRLQFIPTGHDQPLPRQSIPHRPSILTPLVPLESAEEKTGLPQLEPHPYQTFFKVYKPVTKYRKSAPPPPDFRVVVINAATTPLPDMFEFSAMFESVPFTPGEDTLLPPPRPIRVGLPPPTPRPQNPRAKQRPSPPPPSRLRKLLNRLPFFAESKPERRPVPYQRLKLGRRSILVAVVDNGTISILRFSESEFGKLAWSNGRSR